VAESVKAERRGGMKHCAPTLPCGCMVQRGPLVTMCRLHAAAPELLKACKAVRAACKGGDWEEAIKLSISAVSKAEEEEADHG